MIRTGPLLLAAIAFAAAVTLIATTITLIAGVLGGLAGPAGRPLALGPGDSLSTIVGMILDPGSVRKAWPAEVRALLPESPRLLPIVIIATVLTLTAACVAAVPITRAWRSRRLSVQERGAEWAQRSRNDLRRLYVSAPGSLRVVLGRHGRQLVAAEPNASTLVVAPTQAGKSSGIIIPAILEWDGCMVITSVKGDVLPDTYAARTQVGEVRVFDPAGVTDYPTAGWSPIRASPTWSDARRVAATLLGVDMPSNEGSSDQTFWRPSGAPYLAALLLAAHHSNESISTVLAWIKAGGIEELEDVDAALQAAPNRGAQLAKLEIDGLWGMDQRFVSSVRATLATALFAWGDQSVEAALSAPDPITPEWLLDGRNTLYLIAPPAEQHRLAGLFSAILQTIIAEAFRRSARLGGRPISPRLLAVLDEAANIAPLRNLDVIASTGAGQGVTTLTVLQDLSQASTAWGSDKAQSIIANHRARMFGAGIADRPTLDYLGAVLGERVVRHRSTTKDRSDLIGLGSRTESIERLPLLPADEIRQIEEGRWILVYANLRPAIIDGRPWFRDRRLRALAATQAPATGEIPEPPAALAAVAAPTAPAATDAEDEMEPPEGYEDAYNDLSVGPDEAITSGADW